jgi:hypothetical protein
MAIERASGSVKETWWSGTSDICVSICLPYIHRHKKLRIKLTEHHVATYPRCGQKTDQRNRDRRALPRALDRVLRYDAPEAAVAVALHPPESALFLDLFKRGKSWQNARATHAIAVDTT